MTLTFELKFLKISPKLPISTSVREPFTKNILDLHLQFYRKKKMMRHDSQNNYFLDQIGRVIMMFVTQFTYDICTCTSNSFTYLENFCMTLFIF